MTQPSDGQASRPAEQVVIGLGRAGTLHVEGLWHDQAEAMRRAWSRCPPPSPDDARSREPGPDSAGAEGAPPELVRRWDEEGQEASGPAWDAFHEAVAQAAAHQVISAGRGRSLMLHAAAVADRSGRAVVLAAPSGTGKTTGSIALGRRWGYLTDETVVVDPHSGQIEPFPKPLSVLGPQRRRPKVQQGPDELGLLHPPPSRLHAIGVLRRADPADPRPPQLERLSLLEALAHLVPQTSSLALLERGLVTLIRTIEDAGGAWALHYTQSPGLIGLTERLLAPPQDGTEPRATEDPASWWPVPEDQLRPSPEPALEPGLIRAAAADDAVVLDSPQGPVLLLLSGESFSSVAGIGPLLWDLARQWRRRADLVDELAGQPGAPPDAARRVEEAIDELLERGLLQRSD